VLTEALEQTQVAGRHPLHIFATDIDADAIDTARQGIYAGATLANVSSDRRQRFFTPRVHTTAFGRASES